MRMMATEKSQAGRARLGRNEVRVDLVERRREAGMEGLNELGRGGEGEARLGPVMRGPQEGCSMEDRIRSSRSTGRSGSTV
ncbi:unnamed protein product [Calypogeia fissa]